MKEKNQLVEFGEKIKLLDYVDFEVLPTEKAVSLIEKIPRSSQIRVTCRPTGYGDSLSFFEKLGEENKERTILHLAAARVAGDVEMDILSDSVKKEGIKKVFLVRGDGRLGSNKYHDTVSLIRAFCERGVVFEKIDVAGHPEGNPMDPTAIETLLVKQELSESLGVEMEIVTQMCFDEERFIDWLIDIRKKGVYLPVRVGVLGKVRWDTFLKVLSSLGVEDVLAFLNSKPKLAIKMAEYSVFGYNPEDFLRSLMSGGAMDLGVVGTSVFTLGNISTSVEEIKRIAR